MKKILALVLAFCMVFAFAATACADWAPSGPVTMIIPYATGGSADILGRLVAQYLGDAIGVKINCINKEGASGVVGSTELVNAKTDGLTLGLISPSDLYVADFRGTFDTESLQWLVWFNSVPFALFASPNSHWNDIGELLDDIKANNPKIAMAESGTAHLIGLAQMCRSAGIDKIPTVSFSSGGESQTALLGNHVDLASLTPAYIANVTAGGGKLMAIYGSSKIEQYADYPYALDFGLDVPAIVGSNQTVCLPLGCDEEIVEFWNNALQELITNNEDFKEAMLAGGYCMCNVHGEELTQAIKDNTVAVAEIMTELGLE